MQELDKAIYTKFTELTGSPTPVRNSFYIALGGRFYKNKAPQTVVYPYCVYHMIDDVYDFTFTTHFENVRIQFDIISNQESSTEIEDLYDKLKALFDWCSLSVTSYTHLFMRRELSRITVETDPDLWIYNADYIISIERN